MVPPPSRAFRFRMMLSEPTVAVLGMLKVIWFPYEMVELVGVMTKFRTGTTLLPTVEAMVTELTPAKPYPVIVTAVSPEAEPVRGEEEGEVEVETTVGVTTKSVGEYPVPPDVVTLTSPETAAWGT
jgi:hypothetical protein